MKTYFSKEEVNKLINEVLKYITCVLKDKCDCYFIENDKFENKKWIIKVDKKEYENGFLVYFSHDIPFEIANNFNLPFENWGLKFKKIYSREDLKKIYDSIIDGRNKTRKLIKEINNQEES